MLPWTPIFQVRRFPSYCYSLVGTDLVDLFGVHYHCSYQWTLVQFPAQQQLTANYHLGDKNVWRQRRIALKCVAPYSYFSNTQLIACLLYLPDPNGCDPDPCNGNGKCQSLTTANVAFRCICDAGWGGDTCDQGNIFIFVFFFIGF